MVGQLGLLQVVLNLTDAGADGVPAEEVAVETAAGGHSPDGSRPTSVYKHPPFSQLAHHVKGCRAVPGGGGCRERDSRPVSPTPQPAVPEPGCGRTAPVSAW